MKESTLNNDREIWVDNVKVIACVLVVLGHFFPSLIEADILSNYVVLQWFKQTVYYFHVPLFFVCSGYLYQKYSKIETRESWKRHVIKKLLALGIPYVTFSIITWILKSIFSSSVNNVMGVGMFEMLFFKPTAPYWYLYALFLIFLTTPTFNNKYRAILGLGVALMFKTLKMLGVGNGVYALSTILENEIWFVFGMWLSVSHFLKASKNKHCLYGGVLLGIVFLIVSIGIFDKKIDVRGLSFFMGCMACAAVTMLIAYNFKDNTQNRLFGFMAKYTLPIFLLHTICAAPVRIVMTRIGITNVFLHIVVGGISTFVVPIIIAKIAEHFKCLNFWFYPIKYIKF